MASARLLAATVGTAITLSLLIGIGNALCGDSPPADSSGGGEQVFERLAPLSRIIWSPDRKNLVLVLTDASIWFVRTADPKMRSGSPVPSDRLAMFSGRPMGDGCSCRENGAATIRQWTTRGGLCGWSILRVSLRGRICCHRGLPSRLPGVGGFSRSIGSTTPTFTSQCTAAPDAWGITESTLKTAAMRSFASAAVPSPGRPIELSRLPRIQAVVRIPSAWGS